MRNFSTFISDIVRKPLVLFPLIALFHILMTVYTVWQDIGYSYLWWQIAWMVGYTFFWIFICDYRKWAAWGYLSLTSINLFLYYFAHSQTVMDKYVSSLFILDVLFSFFVLFFYKRFR